MLSDAFGITWYGQDLPEFVTTDGALASFELEQKEERKSSDQSWTAVTELYTTSLSCHSARMTPGIKNGSIFDDGRGCRTETIEPLGRKGYNALYIGFYNDPNVDWSLQDLGCPRNASNKFLAIWADVQDSKFNKVTALFCEASYAVQQVKATIAAANSSVINTVPLEASRPLSQDRFNRTDFEYLVGAGATSVVPRADVPQTNTIDQFHMIKDLGVQWPVSNMAGFALGAGKHPPNAYFDTTTLASSYEAAHKLLFALAVPQLLSTDMIAPNAREGGIKSSVRAVLIVPEFALAVEITLGLVTILVLAFLLKSSFRESQLRVDPASLSDIIHLASSLTSRPVEKSIRPQHSVWTDRVKLEAGRLHFVEKKYNSKSSCAGLLSSTHSSDDRQEQELVRPFEMTLAVGLTFLAILGLAVTVLVTLYCKGASSDGLRLPSTSRTINQLVLNYIPVTFATVLEPFWTLLNRFLCMFQPFEQMRQGQALPSQSLDLKYTSLPPQLVFWRALRVGHLVLAAVCLTGISSNFLAVSLGALFEEDIVQLQSPAVFGSLISLTMNRSLGVSIDTDQNAYKDHRYVSRANISENTTLPAWVTPQFFFVPYDVNASASQEKTMLYRASTPGVKLKTECVQINSTAQAANSSPYNITSSLNLSKTKENGHTITCSIAQPMSGFPTSDTSNASALTVRGLSTSNNPDGSYAAEWFSSMYPTSLTPSTEEIRECAKFTIASFRRANFTSGKASPSDPVLETLHSLGVEATYIGCENTVQVALFDVTVDKGGYVQSFVQTGPFKDESSLLPNHVNISSFNQGINQLIWFDQPSYSMEWHTDLVADKWLSYLIKIHTQSTDFLNPALPPPAVELVGPVLEDLCSRQFAIILGLNIDLFLPAPQGSTTPGVTLVSTTRVLMSRPMLIVSSILLALNIVVAVLYYARRPRKMLKTMPTTIASVLEMIEGSGLAAELADTQCSKDWRIGYGNYVGTDGKPHTGIERRPFVVPWSGT
ncbi:MAG: hypothetical protein LQ352_006702 [Teloschistes flavicans]|nr:MAG: hypothetical protein LQ352_006702 [Teloschistes flavicans]